MSVLDEVGKKTVDELTNQTIPTLLSGVAADVKLATDTIKEVSKSITESLIPAVADGVGMVISSIERLDGAEITIGPIQLMIPEFTIRLKLPFKPVS